MKGRTLNISVVFILFAVSFMVLQNLPSYIAESAHYSILVWTMWFLGFSVAFVKASMD